MNKLKSSDLNHGNSKIITKLENMQIQSQGSNHDHCNQESNETKKLKDNIQQLEVTNNRLSAEIVQLKQRIAYQESKISEEANKLIV